MNLNSTKSQVDFKMKLKLNRYDFWKGCSEEIEEWVAEIRKFRKDGHTFAFAQNFTKGIFFLPPSVEFTQVSR